MTKSELVTFIDPPSGWMYGFPKILPDDVEDLEEWLIDNGYPHDDIEMAMKYSRYWKGQP